MLEVVLAGAACTHVQHKRVVCPGHHGMGKADKALRPPQVTLGAWHPRRLPHIAVQTSEDRLRAGYTLSCPPRSTPQQSASPTPQAPPRPPVPPSHRAGARNLLARQAGPGSNPRQPYDGGGLAVAAATPSGPASSSEQWFQSVAQPHKLRAARQSAGGRQTSRSALRASCERRHRACNHLQKRSRRSHGADEAQAACRSGWRVPVRSRLPPRGHQEFAVCFAVGFQQRAPL